MQACKVSKQASKFVCTPCPGKNAPLPKQNAVKCTVYNTIQ